MVTEEHNRRVWQLTRARLCWGQQVQEYKLAKMAWKKANVLLL